MNTSLVTRRSVLRISAAAAGLSVSQSFHASGNPVHLIVPYPPGGPFDSAARVISNDLQTELGQPVIVENRPGMGGTIGAAAVARSAPDGRTLGLFGPSIALAPALYRRLSFDPSKDFTPISLIGATQLVLVAHPSVPAQNVASLTSAIKEAKGSYMFGSPGSGSISHLLVVEFLQEVQANAHHVPYKGAAPMLEDVVAGKVHFCVTGLQAAVNLIKLKKLTAIGLYGGSRSKNAPSIPTLLEQGVKTGSSSNWAAIFGPASMNPEVATALNSAIVRTISKDNIKTALEKIDFATSATDLGKTAEFFAREIVRYQNLTKQSGVAPN